MNPIQLHPLPRAARVAAIGAVLLVSACATTETSPQLVTSANPTTVYTYNNDQELLKANQNAIAFCVQQDRGTLLTTTFKESSAGVKTATFECSPVGSAVFVPTAYNPSNPYYYYTDNDLLYASQNAEAYCMSQGLFKASSSIVANPDGTRSIRFQCVPR